MYRYVPWVRARRIRPADVRTQNRDTKYRKCIRRRETELRCYDVPTHIICILCIVDLHPCIILQINPTRCTILLSIFIFLLYVFRATICPSSGEITVSMRRWYLSLRMGGVWSVGWSFTPTSRPDATHTEWQIPASHRYSDFSWWWAYGCPKHVEKRTNTLSRIVQLVGFIGKLMDKLNSLFYSRWRMWTD